MISNKTNGLKNRMFIKIIVSILVGPNPLCRAIAHRLYDPDKDGHQDWLIAIVN